MNDHQHFDFLHFQAFILYQIVDVLHNAGSGIEILKET